MPGGNLKLVTAPSVEPVTLAEAKAHLRVDSSSENDLITALIVTARQAAERYTRRAFLQQTWDYALDAAPERDLLELPRPPLISVSSLTTYDDDGDATVFSTANYIVDTNSEPGRVALKAGQVWPTDLRRINAFIVRYVAGYGTLASQLDQQLKDGVLRLIGHLFENREGEAGAVQFAGQLDQALPSDVKALLQPYRILYL